MTISSNTARLEHWVSKLSEREHIVFDMGFVTALEAVIEDFTDSRIKLLSKVQELAQNDDSSDSDYRKQLLARVSVLDLYEELYKKRIKQLKPSLAALGIADISSTE